MTKSILLVLLGTIISVSMFSQTSNDSITIKKIFGGCKFEQNGKTLTYSKMLEQMQSNPEAYNYMKKASDNVGVANIFGFAGSFLVGWPIGTAMAGGKPNWSLAGIGGALFCISIPISSSINKNAAKAVALYNGGQKSQTPSTSLDMKFKMKPDGLAFVVNF